MILNSGLDAACVSDAAAVGTYPAFGKFIDYACFGTGSAAPAASDTALGAQVGGRSNNGGGFAPSSTGGADGSAKVIWAEVTFTRVFSIGGNVNATEWGLAAASTGNLSVRELFRADPLDNSSSPITLTLESGDELQLVVTLRVQADWEYASKSFVITGTAGNDASGTHTGNASLALGTATTAYITALQVIWPGAYWGSLVLCGWSTDQSSVGLADNFSGNPTLVGVNAPSGPTYAPGTYRVDLPFALSTAQWNADIYALNFTNTPNEVAQRQFGYRWIFASPTKLTKASTHKLTLTIRRSIARL